MTDRSHHPVTLPWQRIINTQSAAAAFTAVVNHSRKKLQNEDTDDRRLKESDDDQRATYRSHLILQMSSLTYLLTYLLITVKM